MSADLTQNVSDCVILILSLNNVEHDPAVESVDTVDMDKTVSIDMLDKNAIVRKNVATLSV